MMLVNGETCGSDDEDSDALRLEAMEFAAWRFVCEGFKRFRNFQTLKKERESIVGAERIFMLNRVARAWKCLTESSGNRQVP